MKAVVWVTKKCNRRCGGCITRELRDQVKQVSFEDLMGYEEITISGGEPMLISERVVEMVHRLRLQGFKGKIFLETADVKRIKNYWAVKLLINDVDGITYHLHSSSVEKVKADLISLRRLDQYLKETSGKREGKVDRLLIDKRVYNAEYVSTLSYKWSEVLPVQTRKKGDPLVIPEGTEVVFYDLEAEE